MQHLRRPDYMVGEAVIHPYSNPAVLHHFIRVTGPRTLQGACALCVLSALGHCEPRALVSVGLLREFLPHLRVSRSLVFPLFCTDDGWVVLLAATAGIRSPWPAVPLAGFAGQRPGRLRCCRRGELRAEERPMLCAAGAQGPHGRAGREGSGQRRGCRADAAGAPWAPKPRSSSRAALSRTAAPAPAATPAEGPSLPGCPHCHQDPGPALIPVPTVPIPIPLQSHCNLDPDPGPDPPPSALAAPPSGTGAPDTQPRASSESPAP